jgi:hypothetical protein
MAPTFQAAAGMGAASLEAYDPVIASAILDRLLHHASTINIKGESYRLREKRRAGLLRTAQATEPVTVS